jgi:aryl-alcohol dehydrogenase-like predicted oxidoreductase
MKYQKLGNTDIDVSVIALGCWAFAGGMTWGNQDERDSLATINTALDVGINFFDTAEGYGNGYSEELLGRALEGHRHDVVFASKPSSSKMSKDGIIEACEASLKRLKTDYIDLYQLHWPSRDIPLEETMEAMETLKEQGKVRSIGVCNFGEKDLTELLQISTIQTNQMAYNLIWRAIEFSVKEKCIENNIGILCYSPIAQGLLTGKFKSADEVPEGRARTWHFSSERPNTRHGGEGCEQETFEAVVKIREIADGLQMSMTDLSLAWLIHQRGVTSVLAGGRNPEQVKQNSNAAEIHLSSDIIQMLNNATEPLKNKLGDNPDMWSNRIR